MLSTSMRRLVWAWTTLVLAQASAHHFQVKPVGGKANVLEVLKALSTTRSSGA